MTTFKTILMTAAMMAVPAAAFAQVDAITDQVKDKAVDTVLENATTDDAIVAGTTMLKGGSKTDAAVAVVKNRVDDKVDSMTGGDVSMDDLSKDGMIEAGKDYAADKAAGSATTYTDGVAAGDVMDSAKGSATTYASDKAPSSATTYGSAVIPKSGVMTDTTTGTLSAPAATTTALPPVNCPSGTTAQADGTCMITGNWGG